MEKNLLDEVNRFIRNGKINEAKQLFDNERPTSLSLDESIGWAKVGRLLEEHSVVISLLYDYVLSNTKNINDEAFGELAFAYSCTGAFQKAFELLGRMNVQTQINGLKLYNFYYGLCSLSKWDYKVACSHFEECLSEDIGEEDSIILRVYRLSCYNYLGEHKSVLKEIESLRSEAIPLRLFAGIEKNEILALIGCKKWREAKELLKKSDNSSHKMNTLFIQKWSFVLSLMSEGLTNDTQELLNGARRKARDNRHWETLRDLDYFVAVKTDDHDLARKLYFGTPHESFKEKLIMKFEFLKNEKYYEFIANKEEIKSEYKIHLGTAEFNGRVLKNIEPGEALHKFLRQLIWDVYEPSDIKSLHAAIYPNEFFNPETSASKIQRLGVRLNQVIERERLPLVVTQNNGTYRLRATEPVTFIIPNHNEKIGPLGIRLKRLIERIGKSTFSVLDVASVMGLQKKNAQEIIEYGISSGQLKMSEEELESHKQYLVQEQDKKVA